MTINQQQDLTQRQNFYCKIFINQVEIIPQNIISLTIREWVFDLLPRLELILADDGLLTEAKPLKDNSLIQLTIGRHANDDELITCEFIKQDHTVDIISNKITNIAITAVLNVNNLFYPIQNKSFANLNSLTVLQRLSNDLNLSFKTSDALITNDMMNWLQINQTNADMIKHVLKRSYRQNDAMLCYISLERDMITNKNILNYKSIKLEADKVLSTNAQLNLFKFSNSNLEPNDRNTIWYNTYDIKNIEGYSNVNYAYGIKNSYLKYDTMSEESTTINGNETILVDEAPKSVNNSVKYNNYGLKFDSIIQNNVYNKYYDAKAMNEYNIWSFFNQSILLNINASYNVKLFDKVNLILPSLLESNINDVYSGEYLVGGILHNLSKGNIYRKQISLHRAGVNRATFGIS